MKKFTLSLAMIALMAISTMTMAQVSLPWDYSFDGFPDELPTGVTQTGCVARTSGFAKTIPAGELNSGGDWFQIEIDEAPGVLTWWLRMSDYLGKYWEGELYVMESANGTDWDTLRSFVNSDPGTDLGYTSWQEMSDTLDYETRYIKFSQPANDAMNAFVDDLSISVPTWAPDKEIALSQSGSTIDDGGVANIGTSSTVKIAIHNYALKADSILNISSYTLTGADAADFGITGLTTPATINGGDSIEITVSFTPSGSDGSKKATLTINSDDADEAAYNITLYGIVGSYATEPAASPTALTFGNKKSYNYDVSYTASASAEYYLVLRSTGTIGTDPTDGSTYQKGDYIGTAKVEYVGDATSYTPTFVVAGTTYNYKVYSFNGPEGFENYLSTDPLSGTHTTADSEEGTYYSSIDVTQSSFVSDLHTKLKNDHQNVANQYSEYVTYMVQDIETIDTTDGKLAVPCFYSGYYKVWDPETEQGVNWSTFSREHVFCKSWMGDPTDGSDEHDDYHGLLTAHQNSVNAVRSNFPLGDVSSTTSSFEDSKIGTDTRGYTVFEPRDEAKGDAARAIFYMLVRYDDKDLINSTSDDFAKQDFATLVKWHYEDLPDGYEMARNDYIAEVQGNRNPFIDNPDWVCYINWDDLSYTTDPTTPCDGSVSGYKPTAYTSSSDSITDSTALLIGYLKPNGSATTCYFEYGTDSTLGATVNASPASLDSSAANTEVTATLAGLTAETTYFFRVKGTNDIGTSYGDILSFTTGATGTEIALSYSLNIYPNPVTNGTMFIKTDKVLERIEVYSITGVKLIDEQIYSAGQIAVNLNSNYSGMIIVKATVEGKTEIYRLIVQ